MERGKSSGSGTIEIMSEETSIEKLHFVLVHGAGHGAWCWYKLRFLMETSGYKVTCLDLKGAGIDQTDPQTITSFDQYNQPLIDFFIHLPENEKVILVGHSAGGLSVTDCIHRFGTKKIHMAFYVAAIMLKNGFVTDEDFEDGQPDIPGPGKFTYPQIPTEDSVLVSMLLRPPAKAIMRAQFTDGPDADRVPRVYIKTLYDQTLKPDKQQAAMIRRWPPSQVFDIESDHSPFFSNLFVLFGFIVKAVASLNL